VVYFPSLNAAFTDKAALRNDGPTADPHPADILRGFVAAATLRLLSFGGAARWADIIDQETEKDVTQIRIGGVPISLERAKRSCEIVANVIAAMPMYALDNYSLIDIQNWRNEDEDITQELKRSLVSSFPINASREAGFFAAHVVAVAVQSALARDPTVDDIFKRMIAILKQMHDANASWGPLFVAHPGSIFRDFTYVRYMREDNGPTPLIHTDYRPTGVKREAASLTSAAGQHRTEYVLWQGTGLEATSSPVHLQG
jgi:hypothetical protein